MGSHLEKNSTAARKRIEGHTFTDEGGEEYEPSAFGGFPDYFRRKKMKLQNLDHELRASSGDKPQIFKGVVAHVTGYTQPPLHVLHKELVQHGAGFIQYLDHKTMATHIIASSMPPKKALEHRQLRVVKPAWVMDSIQAGKMLSWADYRVIEESPRQKMIKFDGGKMFSSQSTRSSQQGYRDQIEASFYTDQFRKPAGSLASQAASSSAFQPMSTFPSKLALAAADEGIEDIDDMEDLDVDLLKVADATDEQVTPDEPPPPDTHQGTQRLEPVTSPTEDQPGIPEQQGTSEKPEKPDRPPDAKTITPEEHNALLLADPHMRKSSTANPDFLKQFYSESRLHHLSTWKAQLKSRMQALAAEKGPTVKPARKKGSRRYIMHVDFDSFFCAVSLKRAPEYRDKPAVVAHGNGSGSEIASCNYPARAFGVKNGMWMKRAQELCPDLKILPYDFPGYEEASRLFYDAILEVGGIVQSVSIDEALVDITSIVLSAAVSVGIGVSEGSIWREQEKADEMATKLRQRIKEKTGCDVSVGIGGNILLAKVALRKAKPAGQYQIKPEEVLDILGGLKVEDLPGVAYSIGGKLEEIGVKFVSDIRQTSKERLTSVLGPKTGEKLWEYARGIDRTEVGEQPVRKSVSAEVNWGIRFINQEEAEEFVRNLSKELERRLLNEGVKGKHLTMKIMRRAADAPLDPPKHLGHGTCDAFNKSVEFGVATNNWELIGKEAVAILRSYKFSPGDLRGLGVQMTKLEPLKVSDTRPDGSQKKLDFGRFAPTAAISTSITNTTPTSAKKPKAQDTEPIDDDIDSPEKAKPVPGPSKSKPEAAVEEDDIEVDPLTPRKPKPKVHPALALAKANEADEKATTPLNISGTQFVIPSHPDPAILAELPQDIRSKLLQQINKKSAASSRDPSPAVVVSNNNSRAQSPAVFGAEDIPSDVDPEVFQALPEDVKAEIMTEYRQRKQRQRQQSLPLQSPRKDRVIGRPKAAVTPTKRNKVRDIFSKAVAKERANDAKKKLVQAKFTINRPGPGPVPGAVVEDIELDQEFLAELPEDVRNELIEEHQKRRVAQTGSGLLRLEKPAQPSKYRGRFVPAPAGPTMVKFPKRPMTVFAQQQQKDPGLNTLQAVKDMLTAWHSETVDIGPHEDDVEVLKTYVKRVVTVEKDMEKARRLVKWLDWTVEEEGLDDNEEEEEEEQGEEEGEGEQEEQKEGRRKGQNGRGKEVWREAVQKVKNAVQEAMAVRGLGAMDLG
ncbi:hypothetical protein QBC46DRAFT_340453 [Diplogelasinospora grovesii]|uniref:DNA repair protein REV1 n=1 Tax=Diplogelasinospora grovesii TaxID=303347 RepID=A0AAN6NAM6_9PEZI|nr:hypothetical protein QBC46DRAFT_340453 [Diplogelasinospora grovesii]